MVYPRVEMDAVALRVAHSTFHGRKDYSVHVRGDAPIGEMSERPSALQSVRDPASVDPHLSRRRFLAGMTALGIAAAGAGAVQSSTAEVARASSPTPHYVVLIVLDAFRPDYANLAPMPTLASLARSGTQYDRAWVGHIESETPTGHASISTGTLPKNNGIIGFEWRDAQTGQEVLDGWPTGVLAGRMEHDLREAGVGSIPLAIKAAEPTARIVAISSEKVYAAGAMGGWAADYILYHAHNPAKTALVPTAVAGHTPPANFMARPNLQSPLPLKHFTDWDYLSAELAVSAVQEFRPKLLMVNLPGPDVYGHPYGGPASPQVMKLVVEGIDRNVARIVDAYKQAGLFDQTLFVITSDHGMVQNNRSVDGAITKAVVGQAGGHYMFHTGGTAAYIYLHDPAAAPNVAKAMASVPNVVGAYHRVPGQGSFSFERASGTRMDPALDAAYRYLLTTFAGPIAPDVVAPFRENTIGSRINSAHGDHGGPNWGAQHVPLILSGPGVNTRTVSHYPARLVDVAPTVLHLLGLATPQPDGVVLQDALIDATSDELASFLGGARAPSAHQDALIAQSNSNIAEDLRAHIQPPPSLPPQP